MSVDLGNLIDAVRAAVSPPGEDSFANATDDEYLTRLINGFWHAVLDGVISGYTVTDEGILTPTTGTVDMPREMQQIIVFYTSMDVVINAIRQLNTMTRSVAGPVEFEVQKSANTLRDILKELNAQRAILLARLSDLGVSSTAYIDGVLSRQESMLYGDTPYVTSQESTAYWHRNY